ncbi:MAG: hypothetical protein JRG96_04920 [Deltaproteobacteria bacterium]|nr:hypothetical protein [Deltaproteobacteria bacterium]MBW2421008.1 hypothetical protein [Deltaproteobacteria bacterium]
MLNRVLAALSITALVVGVAAWSQPDLASEDLWWHLASGRFIVEKLEIPAGDPFSHTATGAAWTNPEWLWQVTAHLVHRIGPDAVAWANLTVVVLTFLLIHFACLQLSGSWLASAVATALAAVASHAFIDVRPHLVTLLFTAAFLAVRERRWAPWIVPPLLLLWVNVHGGFIFGLGLAGLDALVRSLQSLRAGTGLPTARWIGVALGAVAVAVNPVGLHIYLLPFEPLGETLFQGLVEWAPAQMSLDFTTWAGRFGWMLLAVVASLWAARRQPYWLALAAVTLVMALLARRFIPLFAITGAPIVALGIARLVEAVEARFPASPHRQLGLALAALGLAVWSWQGVHFADAPLRRWTASEALPSGAVAYLSALPSPPRKLLNAYTWGGFISFTAPILPVFIDGRAGTVYDEQVIQDYFTLLSASEGWQRVMREREIDGVLLEPGMPLLNHLDRAGWFRYNPDPRSVLMLPLEGRGRPTNVQLLGDTADTWLSRGTRAFRQRKLGVARSALEQAVRLDPLQLYAYGMLMNVEALDGNPDGIALWLERGLRIYPRRANGLWSFAEVAYRLADDHDARVHALRQIRSNSPFVAEVDTEEVIAAIEEERRQRTMTRAPTGVGPK